MNNVLVVKADKLVHDSMKLSPGCSATYQSRHILVPWVSFSRSVGFSKIIAGSPGFTHAGVFCWRRCIHKSGKPKKSTTNVLGRGIQAGAPAAWATSRQ